jgi:hypothetical protein
MVAYLSLDEDGGHAMDPTEGPSPSSNGDWCTRYRDTVEVDYCGRRLFRFHRRFPQPPIDSLDVLFAVSVAKAVLALSDSVSSDVDHVELYLRPHDAFRLGPELHSDTNRPAWASAAEVVYGEPEGDAHLTVILGKPPMPPDDCPESPDEQQPVSTPAATPKPISHADRLKMRRWLHAFVRRGRDR